MDLFGLIVQLAEKDGANPVSKFPGLWERKVNDQWEIKVNGHEEEIKGVPPFTCAVFYNGWPAGMLDPFGGLIAAGTEANEETFAQALQEAIKEG